MSRVTYINMSQLPLDKVEFAIKDLIEELKYTSATLQEATCENIVNRICTNGYEFANGVNNGMPSNDPQKSYVDMNVSGNKGEVSLNGEGAVYDEFGTGEEGLANPHPMKGDFTDLNPYNSGPYVSTHINPSNGRHYWIYPPMGGKPYFDANGYTEGIPSGKQMYQTLNYIRKIKENIIREEVQDALQTLK